MTAKQQMLIENKVRKIVKKVVNENINSFYKAYLRGYEEGYTDSFSYIPDYDKETMQYWGFGFKSGKNKKTKLDIDSLQNGFIEYSNRTTK